MVSSGRFTTGPPLLLPGGLKDVGSMSKGSWPMAENSDKTAKPKRRTPVFAVIVRGSSYSILLAALAPTSTDEGLNVDRPRGFE
jgi:hypothetical protein